MKGVIKSLMRRWHLFSHKGTKYVCPICGYASKDLAEIGIDSPALNKYKVVGGGLRRGGCYRCGAADRVKLLFHLLNDELKIFSGNKDIAILHIAPEKHISRIFLQKGFTKYTCGDLFTEGYHYPDYVQNLNVLHLPFPDNQFDLIICNHVLEHIPEDADAMRELYRVMKPGGMGIFQVPFSAGLASTLEDPTVTSPSDRERVFGQYDHVRIYGRDYPKRLERVGFTMEIRNISAKYPLSGLAQNEDLFIAVKPKVQQAENTSPARGK